MLRAGGIAAGLYTRSCESHITYRQMLVHVLTECRTDIEQETNGLYTFDRKEKLDSAKVRAVMQEAAQMFYKRVNG